MCARGEESSGARNQKKQNHKLLDGAAGLLFTQAHRWRQKAARALADRGRLA